MAQFVKLADGYTNLDLVASIHRQRGGEYRIRWSSNMIEVISSTDGDAIVAAIDSEASDAGEATSKPERKPPQNNRKLAKPSSRKAKN